MKRRALIFSTAVCLTLFLLILGPAMAAASPAHAAPQTFTVLVGWENPHQGIGLTAYFPDDLTVHVGDTVHWLQNSNEIHTVTFLGGLPIADVPLIIFAPPGGLSPLMFNPEAVFPAPAPAAGLVDTSTFVNSGLMGRETGQARDFSVMFSAAGEYDYLCLVHGVMMSGKITVVPAGTPIYSPQQALAQGRRQVAALLAQVPAVQRAANMQIVPSVKNADGTKTHTVMIGYASGQIDLMQFFPNTLRVRPGDTVHWELSPANDAPHTVTFLNGTDDPPLAVFVAPLLYLNPAVLFPDGSDTLTRTGMFNSGLLAPGTPDTDYMLKIGSMAPGLLRYQCLLHDTSGMRGTLMVLPPR